MPARARGFTLIELVVVITLVGILAVFALPRMETDIYASSEFHDKTVAALRFAQKTAVSHRRTVCVAFPDAHRVVLTIARSYGGACDASLPLPGEQGNVVTSRQSTVAYFDPVPVGWNFQADGTGASRSLSIHGAPSAITVVGETGYVQ